MARSRKGNRSASARTDGSTSVSRNNSAAPAVSATNGMSDALVTAPSATGSTGSGSNSWRRHITGKRILLGISVVVLLLAITGFLYVYITIQKALPTTDGAARLEGLSTSATVTRDKYGVPHIMAANVEDLYAAQGYVHAQDRLFQMFYYRQLGEGKLAEVFGPPAAYPDIFLRTIGLRRAAEAEWKQMSPEVQKAVQAYSRGVNAFLHTHSDSLPLEFTLLGAKVADWQPVDTIAFGKVMAWDLSGNWDQELAMSDLQARLGPERAAQLFPPYPSEGPFIVPSANSGGVMGKGSGIGDQGSVSSGLITDPRSLIPDPSSSLQAFHEKVQPWLPNTGISGLGSNNWVIDGAKSATGKPLLSNDPHLSVQNPSIWYEVHLSTTDGKYDAAGFGFAGVPGIITGHNQNIAWGVTNVEGDVQDLFIEKLDPTGHPGQYQSSDGWKPMQITTETITIKDTEPMTQVIRFTNHGPLLSDALTTISSTLGMSLTQPISLTAGMPLTQPIAFQWTAAKPGHIIEAVFALQTASNWQEFRAALSKWNAPGQNFVYADTKGNIGYQMTGDQPIRKKGNGKAPVPGWTGEYDWSGYVPFDDLPRAYNPPEHFIATANNKNFGPDYKYPIEGYWAPPWRISRILEMLKAKDKLSVGDFKTMLMDTNSLMARHVAPILAKLKPDPAQTVEITAVNLLKNWDGNISADSPAAAIYEVTIQNAISETLADDLGDNFYPEYLDSAGSEVLRSLESLVDKPKDPFWDKTDTSAHEKRDDILLASLTDAVRDLTGAIGPDPNEWTWGKLHTILPRHTFGSQPLISSIFNLPSLPLGGDGTTVSVGGYDLLVPYSVISHQSYRMIIDVGDWSKSLGIYAGGQSGQPYSKHWGDMFSNWQQGAFDPMFYSKTDIEANKEGVLTLNP